ncbi:MAG: NmrA family NAD(P)-binding protein [Anaerolineales bacterium]|nr:NmrA family NAD(P)-binding protein [Anaerolineales bacterium]
MILLTGAAGKTGRAILAALNKQGASTRAFVRDHKQADSLSEFHGIDFAIGDLGDFNSLANAVKGVDKIYYICPNLSKQELEIAQNLLILAKKHNINHFVYHSVLHPQIEKMPHHWQKMRVEEMIFESGINFTILQPCAYMQNLLGNWKSIINEGIYSVPYALSSRLSILDLADLGQAAANILMQNSHLNAIYELAGPQALSQEEVAKILSECLNKVVVAKTIDRQTWAANVRNSGMQENEISILIKMFEYYENFGLVGNSSILTQLLGRKPSSLSDFIKRYLSSGGNH